MWTQDPAGCLERGRRPVLFRMPARPIRYLLNPSRNLIRFSGSLRMSFVLGEQPRRQTYEVGHDTPAGLKPCGESGRS
jgi:hypothetical protein